MGCPGSQAVSRANGKVRRVGMPGCPLVDGSGASIPDLCERRFAAIERQLSVSAQQLDRLNQTAEQTLAIVKLFGGNGGK
jgi:hypothetical protein